MICVYTAFPGNRIEYALHVLFGAVGLPYQIIHDEAAFMASDGIKICYGNASPPGVLNIMPSGILRDGAIAPAHLPCGRWHDVPTLFHHGLGECGFDLPGAVFWLSSRMEEYGSVIRDNLGRYDDSQSLTVRHGWHNRPLIDEWRNHLLALLAERFPGQCPKLPSGGGEVTVDVDSAFAYRHKGVYRTAGALVRDLICGNRKALGERMAALTGKAQDPYDTYAYIRETCRRHGVSLRWFFLLADFGAHDKNLSYRRPALRTLIRTLTGESPVGIHPGMGSHTSRVKLKTEIGRLQEITGMAVTDSRQHYLRLELPLTYRRLEALGIRADHSMGYAFDTGFRLGTTWPVRWYDADAERMSDLLLVPFCAMDTSLRKYQRMTPAAACERLGELHQLVRATGGHFRVLWHNESVSGHGEWKGWKPVFEEACRLAGQ